MRGGEMGDGEVGGGWVMGDGMALHGVWDST